MKNGRITRVLALALTLALCLSLVPISARAGYTQAEAIYYDLVGSHDQSADSYLMQDQNGDIKLSLSGGVPEGNTINSIYLVPYDNHSNRVGTIFLNGKAPSGATGGYEGSSSEIFYNAVWIQNVTLSNVPAGIYQTEYVTNNGSIFSNDVSDQWHSVSGTIEVVEYNGSGTRVSITTNALDQGYVSEDYSFTMSGSGTITTWSATGLPSGWSISNAGIITGAALSSTGTYQVTVTATGDTGSATRTYTLTIGAERTFNVTYYLNGGTGSVTNLTGNHYNDTITLPAAPTRNGYTFAGWSDSSATYNAEASYTITKNTTLRAQWTALPGVTVNIPSDLGQVVGSINLYGTLSGSNEQTLWGKICRTPTDLPTTIDLSAAALGGNTYSKLTLKAYVDGQEKEIASYTAPSGSPIMAPTTGTTNAEVTLTKADLSYTILKAVEVKASTEANAALLTEGVDYTVAQLKQGSTYISPYSLPMLVTDSANTKYSVKLNGVQGSPRFTEYNWAATTNDLTVVNNKLTLAPPALGNTVAVSGTVFWAKENGAASENKASYVTVQATQVVGGVSRTITANTDRNGNYNNLNLYSDVPATFTVLNGWRTLYVTGDKTLNPSAGSTTNTKDLTVKQVRLSTDITLKTNDATPTDAQKALAERYLSAMDWMGELTMKVTQTENTHPDSFTFAPGSLDTYRDSSYLYNTAAADSLTCELTGSIIPKATGTVNQEANGDWSVSFSPTLNPGVVVDLKAGQTMSVFFAYFDASGALIGESSSFAISEYHSDYAQPCPAETKTVALLPGSYKGTLQKTVVDGNTVTITGIAYSDLTETGSTYEVLKTWTINTAMAEGKIEALETYEISKEATENALFVTKPSSTLFASAESFVGDSDLISFTGSIGLDAGLKGGKLTALYINPKSAQAEGYNNTATVQTLVIDGQAYTPTVSGSGVYYVEFNNNAIDLPCDYSVYCTPGSMTWDMSLTVTADVQYTGGNGNVQDQSSQLVGSAVVTRPGASLDTLSTFVCEDKVLISGTAEPGQSVTIYDDGAVVGTATGDGRWGEWTALVPLHGADMSEAKLPTSHKLYAVSASGVVSDPLTVIHYKDGPQLKLFTMSWKSYHGSSTVHIINVGDAYTYTGGMYDTTFTARFDNPNALDTKTGWSSKVIFKVYTTDGEIRFLEAAGGADGVFTATVPTPLRSSVTSAEVMYEPIVPGGMTVDLNGVATGQAPKEYVDAVREAAGDVKKDLDDKALYPTRSYVVNYGNDGKPTEIKQYNYDVTVDKTTRNANEQLFYHSGDDAAEEETTITINDNPTDELVKMVKEYNDAGLRVNSIRTVEDSGISLKSWLDSVVFDVSALNHIAYDERSADSDAGSSRSRAYSISQLYRGGQIKDGNDFRDMTAEEAFEHEKSFMEAAKNTFPDMTHTKLALENDGDSYDVYQIILANQGTGLEDCNLTVTFLACDGVYSMAATAIFSPQYCSKMIGDKWDTEIKPTAEAAIAAKQNAGTTGSLLLVTASANGYVSVSNGLLAAEVDERLPIEDDQNSYLFKDVQGERIESDHQEYMRSIRTSVGLPAEEATDEWEILRRQQLHNYDEGKDGKWSDPAYYFYNGDFKPRSSIAQSCMSDVNAYYSRQRSDVATTGLSTTEEWTGHGNLGAALTSGVDPTKISTYAGDATAGANILLNTINSHEAKNDLRAMMGDLNQLKNSPCYKKLNESQRELVDKSYDEFKYWYDSAMNQITGTQVLGAACNVGGCVNSRVKYAGKLTSLRNWGAGVVLSGAGEMNSAVGGQMIKTSFTNAIVTYNEGFKQMKGVLRSRSVQLEDPDCKGKPVSTAGPENDDGEKKNNKTGNDPSGIVYEGVLQNPVEGAVVTLYYGANGNGYGVKESTTTANTPANTVAQLKRADDVRTLIPDQATQTTGPDGRYQWGVPEGLWYVTAEYGGLMGNSNNDTAATVTLSSNVTVGTQSVTKLLPVLPVQLDVNIPLIDTTAPVVEAVNFTTEGIYVTFSKYMVDSTAANDTTSVLNKDIYTLYNASSVITGFTVVPMDQGNTPANIDGTNTKTYTRTVCLKPATGTTFPTGTMNLTVNGTVQSYAKTEMGAAYSTEQTVTAMTTLAAPNFFPASGATVQRGDTVSINAPTSASTGTVMWPTDGVKIYYTTDGTTTPSAETGTLYDGPIAITDNMTIKAIAVCVGYKDSTSANAAYSIKDKLTPEQYDGAGNGNGAGAGGGSAGSAVNLPASLTGGTVAVSPTIAAKGTKVTITPTPDAGYQVEKVSVTDSTGNPVAVNDNGDGTYCFTMPAGAVNVDVTFRPEGWKFVDVAGDAWYHDAVYHCYNRGYFKGTDEDHFTPKGTMTRAMFATVLYRIAGEPAAAGANPFSDVAAGKWYTDAVIWAAGQKVIEGYGSGKFGPNDPVTREQMVTIFWRYNGKPAATADLSGFRDAGEISDWAKDAFAWAVSAGVIIGKGNGILDPKGTATRAEVAQIVMNYDTKVG